MKSARTDIATAVLAAMVAFFAAGSGLTAQTPAPPPAPAQKAPGTPAAPAQKTPAPPSGIQTLPAPSPRDSVKPDDVVLTIGPEKITRARFEQIKQGMPPQYAGVPAQMGEKGFANNYATFRSLAMLAEREKLDQTAAFREQMSFMRTELMARLALGQLSIRSQTLTDDEMQAYLNAHKDDYQQARVKGIFVALNPPAKPVPPANPERSAPGSPAAAAPPPPEPPKARTDAEARARAEELRKQIVAGADFAAVAKANSDHANAEKGGDFGVIRKNQLPPNLEKVVFVLKPKEVSDPVKEGQGYYIFQVEELRAITLDEAAATIRGVLTDQKMQAEMKGVQAQFPVVYNDQYFVEAAPAAGSGARPVITGVAPAQPQPAPAPAAKKP